MSGVGTLESLEHARACDKQTYEAGLGLQKWAIMLRKGSGAIHQMHAAMLHSLSLATFCKVLEKVDVKVDVLDVCPTSLKAGRGIRCLLISSATSYWGAPGIERVHFFRNVASPIQDPF